MDKLFCAISGLAISVLFWQVCSNPILIKFHGGSCGGLVKLLEELKGVNETLYSNLNQFSLMPYTEDPQVLAAEICVPILH